MVTANTISILLFWGIKKPAQKGRVRTWISAGLFDKPNFTKSNHEVLPFGLVGISN